MVNSINILLSKILLYLSYKFKILCNKKMYNVYLNNIQFYGQFDISVDEYLFTRYFLTKKKWVFY